MKYFAYGSNMDPKRMRQRVNKVLKREWAVLKGWKLKFNKIASQPHNSKEKGCANIIKNSKEFVEGVLYEVSKKDIQKLDWYETYPYNYDKTCIKVNLKNGEEVEAMAYIAQPNKIRSGLKPCKKYLNHLLNGCDLLSKKYYVKLKKRKALDQNEKGRITKKPHFLTKYIKMKI